MPSRKQGRRKRGGARGGTHMTITTVTMSTITPSITAGTLVIKSYSAAQLAPDLSGRLVEFMSASVVLIPTFDTANSYPGSEMAQVALQNGVTTTVYAASQPFKALSLVNPTTLTIAPVSPVQRLLRESSSTVDLLQIRIVSSVPAGATGADPRPYSIVMRVKWKVAIDGVPNYVT